MGVMRFWVCALASLALVLLAGCAAGGHSYVSVASSIPPLKENGCRVFFYRTDSVMGMALQPDIRLDNQVVGKSQPGGFFYVDTYPGRHLATSQTEAEAKLEFDIEAGQTAYVASSIGFGLLVGRVQLSLKPESLALSELSPLRYTGTATEPNEQAGAPPFKAPPRAEGSARRVGVTMADLEALLPQLGGGAAK